jgi:hypothetical protein
VEINYARVRLGIHLLVVSETEVLLLIVKHGRAEVVPSFRKNRIPRHSGQLRT